MRFQKIKTAAGLGDKKGQHKNYYTDLKSTLEACQGATQFGLVHSITLHPIGEGTIIVRLTLTHVETKEEIVSEFPLATHYEGVHNQSQAFGSALTYAKKYLLWGAYGLANADDDGEAATDESSNRGSSTSPMRRSITPKEQEPTRLQSLIDQLQEIYKANKEDANKIISDFMERNNIKGTFGADVITSNELVLDLQRLMAAYKIDKQKIKDGTRT